MSERRIDTFFYGLFMDAGLLRSSGIDPANPRKAYVENYALRVGDRATLVPSVGARAHGMLMALTHLELERLYGAPGLDLYRAEAALARQPDAAPVAALCYNVPVGPRAGLRNSSYAVRLQETLRNLGFPAEYVDAVADA